MKTLKNIYSEPLFHFFLIGLLIYLAYGLFNPNKNENSNIVVVSAGEITWLEDNWKKRWNRPPTQEEKKGIIDQLVREKVLYKAAIEMGLDKDDVIIRRRMVQKIEFLTSDIITPPAPKSGELEEFYEENKDHYKSPDVITITQVFFDPDKRGDQTLNDSEEALQTLVFEGEPQNGVTGFGDVFMLQSYYSQRSESDLAKLFGGEFSRSIFELKPGAWYGPVLSGYGTHLVYIHGLERSTPPKFADISDIVKKDWEEKNLIELNELYFETLFSRYEIIIEEDGEV